MSCRDVAAIALVLAGACLSGCRHRDIAAVELRITAEEFEFHMPDSIPAGLVHITLRNNGHDLHEAAIERFTDSLGTAAAFADSIRAHVTFPSNVEDVGGAALTLPGDSSGVWLQLAPGHYAVACWKGDHLERGMVHDLHVVASHGVPGTPPRATRQLTLVNFAFNLDTQFTAGRTVLHVRNAGTEAHEADIYRVTPTAGLPEYFAWLKSGEHGLPPVTPVAGFGDLYPGKEAWIEFDLTPGRYFIVCGVPGIADKLPHYKRGMVAEFSIPPRRSAAAP
jgi:uncharacterized cupredoxin-like copper-binding protein